MDELERRMQRVLDAARDGMSPSATSTERTRRVLLSATAGLAVGMGAGSAAAAAAAGSSGAAVAGAGTTGAGVATVSKGAGLFAALSSLSLSSKVVTAVAVAASVGTAGVLVTHRAEPVSKAAAQIALPANRVVAPAPVFAPARPSEPQLTPAPEIAPEPVPVPAPAAARPNAAHPVEKLLAPDPLTQELSLIERARQGLRNGQPRQALSALDEHRARFQYGVMTEERTALHALALCALGDPRGSDEAQRFLAGHPGSPLAPHLRTGCK